jgi:adenylate kinase family enzyme
LLDDITPIDRVVHITMRVDHLVRKQLGRRVCGSCGVSWNVEGIDEDGIVMPPMLPPSDAAGTCGGSCTGTILAVRADDTEAVIARRQRE